MINDAGVQRSLHTDILHRALLCTLRHPVTCVRVRILSNLEAVSCHCAQQRRRRKNHLRRKISVCNQFQFNSQINVRSRYNNNVIIARNILVHTDLFLFYFCTLFNFLSSLFFNVYLFYCKSVKNSASGKKQILSHFLIILIFVRHHRYSLMFYFANSEYMSQI